MGMLVDGTKYHGEFEERIKKLMDEVRQTKDIILFIDQIHTLIGADGAEGAIDVANILKPALARGELQCIGATTLDEYRKHIEKDPALERRFPPVVVPEPTVDEAIQILRGLKERYELHDKLNYTDGALVAAAELAHQYISDHFVPDKGIDLIDEAGSRVQLKHAKSQHNCPSIYGSLWSRCSCQWIWHDWSDELCLQLLKNCHRTLPENSKVIIVDVILPVEADTQISSHVGYHVDFLMLAYNPGGEEHTPYEFKDLAKQSGFEGGIKVICTINSISVIEFYKNK